MSKKRTSPEASTDEQTNEKDADSVFQRGDEVKRVKLTSLTDTTLQDLPMELVESIFVRAIVMEVKEMQLPRFESKAKADLVLSRLSSVCPDWSNILTTNFFLNELYRTIDRTIPKAIRFEILQRSLLDVSFPKAVSLKDELFVLCQRKREYVSVIKVYDRKNLAVVKDVIDLSEFETEILAACSVSNCLYILNEKKDSEVGVVRIAKEDEHKFNVSPLISVPGSWIPSHLSVVANGKIILWDRYEDEETTKIVVYDESGTFVRKMSLPTIPYELEKIMTKSNGNLVIVSGTEEQEFATKLTEIDINGTIILRQYQSSLCAFGAVSLADANGRIVIIENLDRIELLDNEFNLLNVIVPQMDMDQLVVVAGQLGSFSDLHYNSDTNECVTVWMGTEYVLSIFQLTEK